MYRLSLKLQLISPLFIRSHAKVTHHEEPQLQRQQQQHQQPEHAHLSLAKQTAHNVSRLLDNLLKDYDNSLRPDLEGMTYM